MSKIAENKALKAYPILFSERNGYANTFKYRRESYIKGYDQAMQDFLEKTEEFFNEMYDTMEKPALGKKIIELFKNYMQNE